MRINNKKGLKYLTFSHMIKHENLTHAFTTRFGGVSEGCYESLNFGFNEGDKTENIIENYKRLSNVLNIKLDNMVRAQQTHTSNIKYVTEKDRGKGIVRNRDYKNIDGLITDIPEVAIITYHADCNALFFYDCKKHIIGLAHSGWRGTAKRIAGEMIDRFQKQFNSNPKDILVGIGPSIGQCCFEVDKDVKDIFVDTDKRYLEYIVDKGHKFHIDLWKINKLILKDKGIPNKNIVSANICTKCNVDTFFSHRGQNGKRGTMLAIMMLKNLD